jgi:hypothetical protein
MDFKSKYLKYKKKYLELKNQMGGMDHLKKNSNLSNFSKLSLSNKVRKDFSKNNIEKINLSDIELIMFKYVHYGGMINDFTAVQLLSGNYDKSKIDYSKIIYVAYVLHPESYIKLKNILKNLVPNINLQNHFHMTIGFYLVKNPPNINIAELPNSIICNIKQILKTKDNGILLSSVSISDETKKLLENKGVDFRGKNLHLTLGTQLPYKGFHSNLVLQNWNK